MGLLGIAAPAAQAANGTLPGGTPISVNITNPAANGTVVQSPPGNVNLQGNASIGQGAPTAADTTLVYVVDRSSSTKAGANCGANQNGDTLSNTVLDCEIAAGRALNQAAISAGSVDEVGVVFFAADAAIQDVGPGAGTQSLTAPATDANGNTTPDVEETLRTAQFAGGTNFEAAVQTACRLVQQSSNPKNIVVFLSDGFATAGGNALDDLPCAPKAATFQTFAIGAGSNCDGTGNGRGSLRQIATATGGTCTRVVDVSTLPDILPGIVKPRLTKLELTIDGGTPIDISANATPPPPLNGPASLTYTRLVEGLAAGTHTLCVRARGMDSGGSGSVVACRTVIVVAARISINDVTVNEGNAGTTTPAVFAVTLSAPVPVPVTVKYTTADNTAVAGSDYVAKSGTVTFPANDTSEPVTITVLGDNVNENDETFLVNLSAPTGATILDGQGVGTILDDERNGAFSCRASALNLLGLLEPVVANNPNDPCRDATSGLLSAVLNVIGLTVGASVPNAMTDQTPNDLSASPPAIGDKATAHADLATASISLFGIFAQATDADAKAECTGSGVPTLSASGKVVGLRVNGQTFDILTGPLQINLLLATLRINTTTISGTSIRRRAIWLDNALLPDVIIGEAIAGYSGNPCDA